MHVCLGLQSSLSVRVLCRRPARQAWLKARLSRLSWPTAGLARCMNGCHPSDKQVEQAWRFFQGLRSPKFYVAPMVDQSELAFRELCRRHGATAAYTPMLHARLFAEDPKYRAEHFTTCSTDRPLWVQFCANDPETLLAAARHVETHCDAVDINLGCPQRIARRGHYGAFLMEDWQLIASLVRTLADNLIVPVTCKIRVYPELERTLQYARMIEAAGASLVAVHGRTREQKQAGRVLANWDHIKAVKQALRIPVLANGNIRTLQDVQQCLEYTGVDGVMSAESLLEDPALFSPSRLLPGGAFSHLDGCRLLLEYLDLAEQHPTPLRMVCGHAFKLLGPWLSEHVDLREQLAKTMMDIDSIRALTVELQRRIVASGRTSPVPQLTERAKARLEREATVNKSVAEQVRERRALQALSQHDVHQQAQLVA